MSKQDWTKLLVLILISSVLWTWVWREYKKPIIDPALYSHTQNQDYSID